MKDARLSTVRAPRAGQLPLVRSGGLDHGLVELVQRGRMIVDGAAADLEAAETAHGAFHETAWRCRDSLAEARRSWDRLRAEIGSKQMELALKARPVAVVTLAGAPAQATFSGLIVISGHTYVVKRIAGVESAPIQWRVARLLPQSGAEPYHACRLADRSTQCDCAEWIFRIAQTADRARAHCKHLAALAALDWI